MSKTQSKSAPSCLKNLRMDHLTYHVVSLRWSRRPEDGAERDICTQVCRVKLFVSPSERQNTAKFLSVRSHLALNLNKRKLYCFFYLSISHFVHTSFRENVIRIWLFHWRRTWHHLKFTTFPLVAHCWFVVVLVVWFGLFLICSWDRRLGGVEGSAHSYFHRTEVVLHLCMTLPLFTALFSALGSFNCSFSCFFGWTWQSDFFLIWLNLNFLFDNYPLFLIEKVEKNLFEMKSLFLIVSEYEIKLLTWFENVRF